MTFFVKSSPDMQAESAQTMSGGREGVATGCTLSEWQDGRKSELAGFVLYTAYNGDTANIRQINLTMLSHSLTTHTTRFTMNYVLQTMHVESYAPVYQVIFIPITVPVIAQTPLLSLHSTHWSTSLTKLTVKILLSWFQVIGIWYSWKVESQVIFAYCSSLFGFATDFYDQYMTPDHCWLLELFLLLPTTLL